MDIDVLVWTAHFFRRCKGSRWRTPPVHLNQVERSQAPFLIGSESIEHKSISASGGSPAASSMRMMLGRRECELQRVYGGEVLRREQHVIETSR